MKHVLVGAILLVLATVTDLAKMVVIAVVLARAITTAVELALRIVAQSVLDVVMHAHHVQVVAVVTAPVVATVIAHQTAMAHVGHTAIVVIMGAKPTATVSVQASAVKVTARLMHHIRVGVLAVVVRMPAHRAKPTAMAHVTSHVQIHTNPHLVVAVAVAVALYIAKTHAHIVVEHVVTHVVDIVLVVSISCRAALVLADMALIKTSVSAISKLMYLVHGNLQKFQSLKFPIRGKIFQNNPLNVINKRHRFYGLNLIR